MSCIVTVIVIWGKVYPLSPVVLCTVRLCLRMLLLIPWYCVTLYIPGTVYRETVSQSVIVYIRVLCYPFISHGTVYHETVSQNIIVYVPQYQ